MANNTDLVDAIDEAIECIEDNTYHNGAEFRTYEMDEQQRELVRVSLIRARDALRWIPCEERLPEKSGNYRTTESIQPMGAEGFLYLLNFSYFDKTTKQWKGRGKIVAWMERPSPYTPEEK